MTTQPAHAQVMLAAALVAGGCQHVEPFLPKVEFERLDVNHLSFTDISVDFVFGVDNPNPIDIALESYSYDIDLEGVPLLSGTKRRGFSLEPRGRSELGLPADLVFVESPETEDEFARIAAEIAEAAFVDRSEVSRAVAALESRKLIQRDPNPRNRKSSLISLTPEGKAIYAMVREELTHMYEEWLEDLSGEDRARLDTALRTVMRRIVLSNPDALKP